MSRILFLLIIFNLSLRLTPNYVSAEMSFVSARVVSLSEISEEQLADVLAQAVALTGEIVRTTQAQGETAMLPLSRRTLNRIVQADRTRGLSQFALDKNGRVLGYVLATDSGQGYIELEKMAIRLDAQNSGLGRKLLNQVAVHSLGAVEFRVSYLTSNTSIRALYERLGFTAPAYLQLDMPASWGATRMTISAAALFEGTVPRFEPSACAEILYRN